jgi:hypothetical protein
VILLPNAIADVSVINSLVVYPNPANNSVKISFKAPDEDSQIEIIDALGKTVLRKNVIANSGIVEESFNVSSLSKGIYNIHILSSGKNFYKSLVIQ